MEGTIMARCTCFIAVFFTLALCLTGCSDPSSEPSAVAEKRLLTLLTTGRLIAEPDLPYTIHVKEVKGTTLTEVVFKQRNARGVIELVVHAREGEIRVDADKKRLILRLHTGSSLTKSGERATFDDRAYDLPLSDQFFKE
jgi:hypothetical protein